MVNIMARKNTQNMIDLTPIIKDTSIKINKVTISYEKSGSAKVRFSEKGVTYSHGVGRLDDDLYKERIIGICKNIAIDLKMGRFNGDNWKLTYFGVDKDSKVINFPNSKPTVLPPVKSELTLIEIWENYLKVKGDQLAYNTLNGSIKGVSRYLKYAQNTNSNCVYLENIETFVNILKSKYADSTLSMMLAYLNSACEIAMKQGKITGNPIFLYLDNLKSKQQKKTIEAFLPEDVAKIIATFYDNPYPIKGCRGVLKDGTKKQYYYRNSKELAAYYAPLIEFRFLTGMRPSEAQALTWDNIKDVRKNGVIVVKERLSCDGKNISEGTKNGVYSRVFPINDTLAELIDRLPRIPNKDNLVFPDYVSKSSKIRGSGTGSPSHIFSQIVERLYNDGLISKNLPYYNERHTFITEVAKSGKVNIPTLASLVGNSPETIMKNYFASDNDIVIPDIY
jgi:integrase